jgi:hypothetical protein
MAANEAGAKRQEIPLCARGHENFLGIDAHPTKDHRQLVDKRNIHVTLRVLDDLRGFGNLDARRQVCARGDNRLVDIVDKLGRLMRSGLYPTKKSSFILRPDPVSIIGTQNSSIAPG